MPSQNSATVADIFHRDPSDPRVAIAAGYGLTIRVNRGHLLIEDGIGQHRRQRRYSRAERRLKRLVILGDTGYLSLEAIRWCADVGIAIMQLDRDNRLLTIAGKPGRDDARLRRAQAAALSGTVGVDIAKTLLGAKLDGQAQVAEHDLRAGEVAHRIREFATELAAAGDLMRCREIEALASNAYFGAWSAQVACRFAERDSDRLPAQSMARSS
ncbi:MAG: CRISPR-associated endonuclease Cas1 [Nocardioidaceae bacterium]